MKKQFYDRLRFFATLTILMLFFVSLSAKTVSYEIVKGAAGYVVYNQSANGRYLVLNNSLQILGNRPAIYDVETKKITYLCEDSEGWADAVSNDGTVAGQFLDRTLIFQGEPIYSACTWKDGVIKSLGMNPRYGINQINNPSLGSCAAAITPDGKYVAGYAYISSNTLAPCVWKDGVFHKEYYIEPLDPSDPWQVEGYQGGRAWDISDDGQRICGWITNNKGHWEGNMWYPALWVSSEASSDSYYSTPINETKYWMYLKRMNSSGDVAVGYPGLIMKGDGSYSYEGDNWGDISDNGIMVGPYAIYSEESGVMEVNKYLLKYHGIVIENYSLPGFNAITPDGKYMSGSAMGYDETSPMGNWFPIIVNLDGDPLPVPPTNVKTIAGEEVRSVIISWGAQDFIKTPVGYNIYRNGIKLNTTPITSLSFTDIDVETGKNCYALTAIYDINGIVESNHSKESCIEVVSWPGCYSPKDIKAEVIYNRTVNISWKNPAPNYTQTSETKGSETVLGYVLYRNDTPVNGFDNLITNTYYSEQLMTPGIYTYAVSAIYDDGCASSDLESNVTIEIKPIGTCLPPVNVKTEAIRNNIIVSWEAPIYQQGINVVGYYLYRNDVKISNELIRNTFYTDINVELGTWWYSVKAFYDNSCESPLSPTSMCDVYGNNPPTPPTNLTMDIISADKATLSWNVPPIGNYETLKWYSGNKEWEVGLNDGGTFYVGTKWGADDLGYYFDYSLTDIEFYPTINIPHTFYVYVGDVLVATKEMNSVTPQAFNILKLDTPILVEQGKSLMVAYKVNHKAGEYPVGADLMMGIDGKGNLMSMDGQNWVNASQYDLWANWAMTIRLAPYSVSPSKSMANPNFEINSSENIALSGNRSRSEQAATSIFINKEVLGYNVFKGDVQLNYDLVESKSYTVSIDKSKNECFSVTAYFSNGRGSEPTDEICTYGQCLPALNIEGDVKEKGSVELTWDKPIVPQEYDEYTVQYHSGIKTDAVGFGIDLMFIPAIKCTPINYPNFTDLALTKITAFINDVCKVSLFAVQDGSVILNQKINDIKIGEFNTFEINSNGIKIDSSKDLYVGLMMDVTANTFPIGIDGMPAIINRGDVVSEEGEFFYSMTLGSGGVFNSNWCISAIFEDRSSASNSMVESNFDSNFNVLDLKEILFSGEKSIVESKGYVNEMVVGYDIFRDGNKLNNDLIGTNNFLDETTELDKEYIYFVKTLWNTGCYDNKSNDFRIKVIFNGINDIEGNNITIYPNPAKNVININGEYSSLRVLNLMGATVKEAREQISSLNIADLNNGVYFIEFIDDSQKIIERAKIVISK